MIVIINRPTLTLRVSNAFLPIMCFVDIRALNIFETRVASYCQLLEISLVSFRKIRFESLLR